MHHGGVLENLPRPIGYVLGGGGSLGAMQVGMLQALAEHDAPPDLVVGTSVGSLNGAVLALDPAGAATRLSHLWTRVRKEQIFPGGWFSQVRNLQRSKTHLYGNTALAGLIEDFLGPVRSFDDLTLPFGAVSTDVATALPVTIREGDLEPALLASAAIPGIFPLVEHGGRRLYDGGVVANVPMTQAVQMGAESLVVLDCTFPGQLSESLDTMTDILLFTAIVRMRSQAAMEAPIIASEVPVVYLPGPAAQLISPLDFEHTAELMEQSYAAARRFLQHVEVDGPGLYGSPGS